MHRRYGPSRLPHLLVAILAALPLVAGCGGTDAPERGRVILIGLDGAEWDLIHPMVEAGEMPHLARAMETGVHGPLRSLEPMAKSPAIWTTIATGKPPRVHGIDTFMGDEGRIPVTGNFRKVAALWNILTSLERTVGVVGWLVSWPAEEVNGFVISDYLQYGPRESAKIERRTYPPELESEIADRTVPWREFPWAGIQRFLDQPLDTTSMGVEVRGGLRPIRWITAGDLTFARVGLDLYRERRPDFFSVYLRGMDAMGHLYWNYMIPEAVPPRLIDPALAPYVGGAMKAYYRFTDELIGDFLEEAERDPSTSVIIVSDHGFKGGTGRGVDAHNLDGILVMTGRGVGRGEITGANVYDITPTVLVLMGLPPADDMQGKVLWSALDPEVVPRERFLHGIATYETGERGSDGPIASPVDDEIKERLRSLGYID